MQIRNFLVSAVLVVGGASMNNQVLAQDWSPPSTPDLHEPSDLDYKSSETGLFLGGGLEFGQSRSTEEGGNPGIAYRAIAELGYVSGFTDLTKMETSLEVFTGQLGFDAGNGLDDTKIPLTLGALAKIGFGYSIKKDFYAVWKLGLGTALADMEVDAEGGGTMESDESLMGLVFQGSFVLTKSITDHFGITGTVSWSHWQFDVDELEYEGNQVEVDRRVLVNVPALSVGVRLKM